MLVVIDVESMSMQWVSSFQLDPFMYKCFYSTGRRTVSISQLASVLHFLSYKGSALEEGIPFIHLTVFLGTPAYPSRESPWVHTCQVHTDIVMACVQQAMIERHL